jgi:hypothetical protein
MSSYASERWQPFLYGILCAFLRITSTLHYLARCSLEKSARPLLPLLRAKRPQ